MSLRHPTEADVVVRLLHPNNHSCLLALPFHSHVLVSRSRFFAARLSGRWEHKLTDDSSTHINSNHHSNDSSRASSSNANATTFGKGDDLDDEYDATLHKEPLEHMGFKHFIDIAMPNPSAAAMYKKCLELMYVPQNCTHSCRPFSNVEDAISMLHVAAELLFDDCINDCMQCLEILPSWTAEEESSIRSTLSSLQLPQINADLAARLSLSQSIPSQQPMYTIRRMLVRVLQLACERLPTPPPALKSIDTSKPIPEATVLLVWNANLDIMKTKLKSKSSRIYV